MVSLRIAPAWLLACLPLAGPGCDQDPPAPRGPRPLDRPQNEAPARSGQDRDPAEALDDPDAAGRLEAARALVARGEAGLLRLVAALDRLPPEDRAVRRVALDAVAARITGAAPDERARWVALLSRCGPAARPRLLDLLDHTDPAVRLQALEVLLETGLDKRDHARVLARASDPSPALRRRVIEWAADAEPDGARALFLRAVDDQDAAVCRAAIGVLSARPADAEIARALAGKVTHEDPGVALAAVGALEAMGPAAMAVYPGGVRRALLTAARGASPEVRVRAVGALAAIEQRPAARMRMLIGLLAADHPDVRIEAARCLGAMGEQAARARKPLGRRKSEDPDLEVRAAAARAFLKVIGYQPGTCPTCKKGGCKRRQKRKVRKERGRGAGKVGGG